jgi:hypothetical protein
LKIDSYNVDAWIGFGHAHRECERFKEARDAYQKASNWRLTAAGRSRMHWSARKIKTVHEAKLTKIINRL